MGKCVECGGNISYVTKDILKCEYCGKLYSEIDGNLTSANQATIYETAVMKSQSTNPETLEEAIELFSILGSYKNSGSLEYQCRNQIHQNKIAQEEKKLEERRQAELAEKAYKVQKEKDAQIRKAKLITIATIIGFVVIVGTIIGVSKHSKNVKYENAVSLYEQGHYEEAMEAFEKMGEYKDAKSQVESIRNQIQVRKNTYEQGIAYYNSGAYAEAIQQLQEITDYEDTADYLEQASSILYQQAQDAVNNGDYKLAQEKITAIPEGYSISTQAKALQVEIDQKVAEQEKEENYAQAVSYYDNGQYDLAQQTFIELNDYSDSQNYLSAIGNYYYEQASVLFEQKEYVQCGDILSKIDSSEKWNEYTKAKELFDKAASIYQESIVAEAKNICRSDGYSAMATYIDGFKCNLLDDKEINALKEECNVEVLWLHEMSPLIGKNDDFWGTCSTTDNMGNSYKMQVYCCAEGYSHEITYALDGKYKILTGTIALRDADNDLNKGAWIEFYGDGKLIGESARFVAGTRPCTIEIDVTGVNDLMIKTNSASIYESAFLLTDGFKVSE